MTGKRLSEYEKGIIDGFRLSGKTASEIARFLDRHPSAISRYFKTCPAGETRKEKYSPGRPRKISDHALRVMSRALLKSPRKSMRKLKCEYPDLFNLVKIRTMQDNAVRRLKFLTRSARKKPLLTEKHVQKRLAFARRHKDWTKEQWRGVMWSDESTFKCISDASKKVRRPLYTKGKKFGSPHAPQYLVKTVKHSAYIMLWGAFTGQGGRGSLAFIPQSTTITAKYYLNIMKAKLRDSMEIHGATHFMQDGASVHTAKIVKKWFADNNIQILEWPPQSPDLNPIENLWSFMKYSLQDYDTGSIPKLKAALLELWTQGLQMDTFIKFSDSLPKRIKEVLDAKGGATSY